MKLVSAIIKPFKLDDVREALSLLKATTRMIREKVLGLVTMKTEL